MEFCNYQLDNEYITSKILKGIIWPESFIQLRKDICSLQPIDSIESMGQIYDSIHKELIDKFGLIKDNKLEKYYKGQAPELLEKFVMLQFEAMVLQPLYHSATMEKLIEAENEMVALLDNTENYPMLGDVVAFGASKNQEIIRLDQIQNSLKITLERLSLIIGAYGSGYTLPKKEIYSKYDEKFKMYIAEMYYQLPPSVMDVSLATTIYSTIDSISQLVPKDDLNPIQLDKCRNLVDLLMNPDQYYIKCKQEEIIGQDVPALFFHAYPEYLIALADLYLEDYESMDYQEQVNFRKCFNLKEDNGKLVSLCSAALNNIAVQPVAAA